MSKPMLSAESQELNQPNEIAVEAVFKEIRDAVHSQRTVHARDSFLETFDFVKWQKKMAGLQQCKSGEEITLLLEQGRQEFERAILLHVGDGKPPERTAKIEELLNGFWTESHFISDPSARHVAEIFREAQPSEQLKIREQLGSGLDQLLERTERVNQGIREQIQPPSPVLASEMKWVLERMKAVPSDWFSGAMTKGAPRDAEAGNRRFKVINPRLCNPITERASAIPSELLEKAPVFSRTIERISNITKEFSERVIAESISQWKRSHPAGTQDQLEEYLREDLIRDVEQRWIPDTLKKLMSEIAPLFDELVHLSYHVFKEDPELAKLIRERYLAANAQISDDDLHLAVVYSLCTTFFGRELTKRMEELQKPLSEPNAPQHLILSAVMSVELAGKLGTLIFAAAQVGGNVFSQEHRLKVFEDSLNLLSGYQPDTCREIRARLDQLKPDGVVRVSDPRFGMLEYQVEKLIAVQTSNLETKSKKSGMERINYVMGHLFEKKDVKAFEKIKSGTRGLKVQEILVFFKKAAASLAKKLSQIPVSLGIKASRQSDHP